MKKVIAILLIAVMALGAAACQKTPESPIVVGKDQQKMLEMAKEPAPSDQPVISMESVSREISREKLHIIVNAEVSEPGGQMPVIRVRGVDFTQEQVDAFWNALIGDTEMFLPSETTKTDIEEILINIKRNLEAAETDGDKDRIGHFEKALAEYQKKYALAPDAVEPVRTFGKLEQRQVAEESDNLYTCVIAYESPSDCSGKSFTVKNNYTSPLSGKPDITAARMEYNNYPDAYQFYENAAGRTALSGVYTKEGEFSITPSEAVRQAQAVIDKTAAPFIPGKVELTKNEEGKYAYLIECQRVVNGTPCAVLSGASSEEGRNGLLMRWDYERFRLIVAEEGILSFVWESPIEVGETEVDQSHLMTLDEIIAVLEKMMAVIYEPQSKADMVAALTFHIDQVKLELVRVSEQNATENGLLIPAWRFYGEKRVEYSGENALNSSEYGCFLTVNAIDGSVIDIQKGY